VPRPTAASGNKAPEAVPRPGDVTLLEIYLRQMGDLTPLSREQEVALAKRIERAGNKREARKARGELVKANLRLVIWIARRYINKGVLYLDLIQEGNIGLMKAVDKFEWRRGYRFSTYAAWWIRHYITQAVANQGRTVRIPLREIDKINKLRRVARNLAGEMGHQPTLEQIAGELDIPAEKVHSLLSTSRKILSLDMPVSDEKNLVLGDLIPNPSAPSPADEVAAGELAEQTRDALSILTPRERKVLRLRFGIDEKSDHTLEEVGEDFGVSRERIRQIQTKALIKIKKTRHGKRLKSFTGEGKIDTRDPSNS
jgi:RNA polymerase primary sigma factor